jgi:DNA phosphorothioation-dependent restriction protein DptH
VFREKRVRNLPEFNAVAAPEERLPWWMLVLDEYADLTSDKEDRKEIEARLQRVCQKARASGIHVIVATQKPSQEVISTTIRSNLPAQLALRVKTASDSRVIMDEGGAESLAGKGDAFLKTARGLVRLQCASVKH